MARRFGVDLNGYEHCINHPNVYLRRDRSKLHKRNAAQVYPALRAMEVHAPNGQVRARMRSLRQRYRRLVGPPTAGQQVLEKAILQLATVERARNRYRPREAEVKEEPFKRYEYHRNSRPGERPYTLTYPRRDVGYEIYRRVVEPASKAVRSTVAGLDRLMGMLGRPSDPEVTEGMLRGPF